MTDTIHQRLRRAADELQADRVALSHLADAHGPSAIGTLLVLLSVPCVLPIAGVGSVLGFGLLALAAALWRGQHVVALPTRVAQLELSRSVAHKILGTLARFYDLASRFSRERLAHLAQPGARSWLAPKVAFMGFLIILPMPLGNVLPAISMVLLGLGLAFRDGLAVMLSAAAAVLATAYAAALGVGLWLLGAEGLRRWMGA